MPATVRKLTNYSLYSYFLLFLCALCPSLTLAETTVLGFHWGDTEGNRKLLNAGGYDAKQDHFRQLSPGGNAKLNREVWDLAKQWYVDTKKKDAAGAGFYFSKDCLDSREFGNDLLIVEISAKSEKDLSFQYDDAVKHRSDLALEKNDPSSLELVSRYTSKWHVISRPNTESDSVTIRFRPPEERDADTIFDQSVADKPINKGLDFLGKLSNQITQIRGQGQITSSSRALFQRMFFENGFRYLERIDLASPELDLAKLTPVLKAYLDIIPNAPRTKQLVSRWAQARLVSKNKRWWHKIPLLAPRNPLTSDEIRLLARTLPLLSAEQKQGVAPFVSQLWRGKHFADHFVEFLDINQAMAETWGMTEKKAWQTKLDQNVTAALSAAITPLLERAFDNSTEDERARQRILRLVQYMDGASAEKKREFLALAIKSLQSRARF